MVRKILDTYVEPTAFIVLFFVLINRVILGGGWLSIAHSTFEKVIIECVLWLLDGALFLWIAYQKRNSNEYFISWKRNWLFLIFLVFAVGSIVWSEYFNVSIYKIYVLFFCSAIAAYIGISYPIKELIRKLTWLYIILISLSYCIVIIFPKIGIHYQDVNAGAWRGIFFQKNTLGIMMALGSMVLLFYFSIVKSSINQIFIACCYLLSLALVFLSSSAAGIAIFFIINIFSFFLFALVKWQKKISRYQYIFLGLIIIVLSSLALLKIDFFLGLLNRNTSFTGRVPLWSVLLNLGLSNHPIIGGGFGFPWAGDQLRLMIQNLIGWGYPPITAHNGFVDIFLHLGLVGIIFLIVILLLSLYRSIRNFIKEQSIFNSFPILIIIFIFFANISESLFLELESFLWFLMVYVLFSTTLSWQKNQVLVKK